MIEFLIEEMKVTQIRFPNTSGIGIKPVSREGSERLIRAALNYAIEHKRKSVTLVHKGNIMKFTEGAFRDWGYELNAARVQGQGDRMGRLQRQAARRTNPGQGQHRRHHAPAVAHASRGFRRGGDDESQRRLPLDAMAAQVGGLGIAPGANINYVTGHAIFEATHGTAPKYADQDKVNPGSVILSGVMMLEHLGWQEAADGIIRGLEKTIANKTVTSISSA